MPVLALALTPAPTRSCPGISRHIPLQKRARAARLQDEGWRPAITIRQVLLGIQTLLTEPNDQSPAQEAAFRVFMHNKAEYSRRVLQQAQKYTM